MVSQSYVWHPKRCWELLRAFSEGLRGQSPAQAGVASLEVLSETPGPVFAAESAPKCRGNKLGAARQEWDWVGRVKLPMEEFRNSAHPCAVLSVHRAFL